MPRPKKQDIKVNDKTSLEGLMQEAYNNSCKQITEAQSIINEISKSVIGEDADDVSKLSKEKINALKQKDSAIKIKVELSKIMSDIIKHGGDTQKAAETQSGGSVSNAELEEVRKMMEKNVNNENK